MTPGRTFTLDGAAVHDIGSFYDEINRVFMADESWRLGASLDALDDLLYGGYGALRDAEGEPVRVVWTGSEVSRRALGAAATIAYYREKLRQPETYNQEHFRQLLDAVQRGTGATYFDVVLEVFASHPEIELTLA